MRWSQLVRNAGVWGIVRTLLVSTILAVVAIAMLVGQGTPWPLLAYGLGVAIPFALQRPLVDHVDRVAPILRWMFYGLVVGSTTFGLWRERVDEQIAYPILSGLAMLYLASWTCLASSPRVERRSDD